MLVMILYIFWDTLYLLYIYLRAIHSTRDKKSEKLRKCCRIVKIVFTAFLVFEILDDSISVKSMKIFLYVLCTFNAICSLYLTM